MKLARFRDTAGRERIGRVDGDSLVPFEAAGVTLTHVLEADDPRGFAGSQSEATPIPLDEATLLPPIDAQEVWAAGVTYKRSMAARMEESEVSASCYDHVYEAERPEIFFKATPHRVVGPGQPIRIRYDSKWNVPEPELALVLNSRLELVGFTAGNDMSSRDIEGENPLYLPQAKVYDGCCGLGPWITLADAMPKPDAIGIELVIRRGGDTAFRGTTDAGQMKRSFAELIAWLGRDSTFPAGVILLTGTGVVPEGDFTLTPDDIVDITIDGIGTLTNPVVQGKAT